MSKYDWAEVARVANEAPGSRSLAVAERYGVVRHTANKLISEARKRGFPVASSLAKPGDGALYDRAEIAEVALANLNNMTNAVAARFAVTTSHASMLLSQARKAGYDIPRAKGSMANRAARTPINGLHLVCECGQQFPVLTAGSRGLLRHTLSAHRRPPHPTERTPRAA